MIINQIVKGGGTTPTGTITITNNGITDVTNYANADVQVPTSAPALYREFQLDGSGVLIPNKTTTHIMDFTGIKDIQNYLLFNAYAQNSVITGIIDMSDLTTVSGLSACQYAFSYCTGLTGANLSSLTTISGTNACQYMFQNCTGLTSVDLSSLTTLSAQNALNCAFQRCSNLVSINLSALTTISGAYALSSAFEACVALTSIDLSALTNISGLSALGFSFQGCTSLATVYIGGTTAIDFGTRTNQFSNMFFQCPQNIDVYAPATNQTAIEAMTGYPNFGGTGTVTWHWRS